MDRQMPIYEYVCKECCSRKEIIRKIGDETPVICDSCDAEMSLKISRSSFQIGWGEFYRDGSGRYKWRRVS